MSLKLFFGRLICLFLAVASPGLVIGEVVLSSQGSEYSIVGAQNGDQSWSSVAVSPAGGYIVWQDNAVTPLGSRIQAARLVGGTFTAAGAPFVVSSATKSKTAGDQDKPQVALFDDGGAIIVWQGGKQGAQKIYARFLDSSGSFLTSDVRVNTYMPGYQINPAVAVLADGSAVVVWSSYAQDGSRLGIYAQRIGRTGGKLGPEFRVNQFTLNNQRTPAVAALANTNFVVAWVSELQRGPVSVDVYARIFDPSGAPVTAEFPVNSSPSQVCANPAVAGSPDGGFAVAWSQKEVTPLAIGSVPGVNVTVTQTTRSTNSWDVFCSLFDANGIATAPNAFRLNTYTYGDQFAPKVSAFGSAYLAVWTSLAQDGSAEGIYGQAFTTGGEAVGSEIRVNTTTISKQIQPAICSDGSGYLAVWSSFVAGTGFDLFAQIYLQTEGP